MKSYLQGLITGIILTVSVVLFFGAMQYDGGFIAGRYKLYPTESKDSDGSRKYLLLDTSTGDTYITPGVSYKGKPQLWWDK